MRYPDQYNNEGYLDMTAYLATRNMMPHRTPADEDWVYRRGDIYLANLSPCIGCEQSGIRPVVVLQNNTGNFYCPTVIVAPITSHSDKRQDLPIHYCARNVKGLDRPVSVLLEQLRTIDKHRIRKYLGKMSQRQMDEIGDVLETSPGLCVPEEMEAP